MKLAWLVAGMVLGFALAAVLRGREWDRVRELKVELQRKARRLEVMEPRAAAEPPAPPRPEAPTEPARPSLPPDAPDVDDRKGQGFESALRLRPEQRPALRLVFHEFSARLEELRRTTDWGVAASRLRFESVYASLLSEFDRSVVRLLDPDQARRYWKIPEWYRNPDGPPASAFPRDE